MRVARGVVGDSVRTNDKAGRHLFYHMRRAAAASGVSYCLILIKCASHQSNLVVMVAICGAVVVKPSVSCPVTGACVRLFKYLIPSF